MVALSGTSSKISVTARLREEVARARANNDPDMRKMMADLVFALKIKGEMMLTHSSQTTADCPRCKKHTLHVQLAGNKQHMRAWCATEGCKFSRMME